MIFTRGKVPDEQVLDAADELGLVVLTAPRTMFTCAGIYLSGVGGASLPWRGLNHDSRNYTVVRGVCKGQARLADKRTLKQLGVD